MEGGVEVSRVYEFAVLGFLFTASSDVENEFLEELDLSRTEGETFSLNMSYWQEKIDSK